MFYYRPFYPLDNMNEIKNMEDLSLFEGLPESMLEEVYGIAVQKSYKKGHEIFQAGEDASGFYGIVSGRVKVYRSSLSGREQILHVLGPGEVFAEVAVFQGGTFPANAQTVEKSRVLFIPRREFVEVIRRDPDLAMAMLGLLSGRLRKLVGQVSALSLKEVPSRLAGYILLLRPGQYGDTVKLDLPKSQIASYLGTIPETLSRALKKMVEAKLITTDGTRITIVDLEGLQSLARGEEL